MKLRLLLLGVPLLAAGCRCDQRQPVFLPAALQGKVEWVASCDGNCDRDVLDHAVLPAGQGGIASGVLLKLKEDVTVYRLWDGADRGLNEYGGSNRVGGWWSADRPAGTAEAYRVQNAVCRKWNALRWVAKCRLKAGTLVAVGPTQSVDCSAEEHYPAGGTLQLYVDNTSSRYVDCGKMAGNDYAADPGELLLPAPAAPVPAAPPEAAAPLPATEKKAGQKTKAGRK